MCDGWCREALEEGGVFMLQDESGLDRILNQMRTALIIHPKHGTVLAAGSVYPFIVEFVYQTMLYAIPEQEDAPYAHEILVLKEYIGNHFMYPISLDDLCKVVPVTHQHLCRMFKEALGMRPMEYVNGVRIEMAKSLLCLLRRMLISPRHPLRRIRWGCIGRHLR